MVWRNIATVAIFGKYGRRGERWPRNLRDAVGSAHNSATSCGANPNGTGAVRINIPAEGTENDEKNPARMAPRKLFDLAAGHDNLFHGHGYRWSTRLTLIDLTSKEALYNFLSTFSGRHSVPLRAYSA